MKRNHLTTLIIIVGVALAGVYWYRLLFAPEHNTGSAVLDATTTPNYTSLNFPYYSKLDGSGQTTKANVNPFVIGVMIDNHPDARPERGLSHARVVYEAPVEGSYTRYLALFASNDNVSAVGPVRSARPYFIDWAGEYSAGYFHSGGSPDALNVLASSTLVSDVNEFYNGQYFWRDNVRAKPHNLFTKSTNWQSWAANNVTSTPTWKPWNFVTSVAPLVNLGESANTISIAYAADYTVGWAYDATTTKYQRLINKNLQSDEDGTPITAGTIVVQYVDTKVLDSDGRLAITTLGGGDARVFTAGRLIRGTWQKFPSGHTRFLDALGGEIPFFPGVVWVEVVAKGTPVNVLN